MARVGACLLFVTLICGATVPKAVAQALWEPRPLIVPQRTPRSTAKWEMATAAAVGDLIVMLEKTRLREVATQLGAVLGSSGRGPEHLEWACLAAASGPDPWIAWFGDVVEYVHEHTRRGSPQTGPVRASNGVAIRVRGGIADAIQAWKSTETPAP